jgi:hypothetical protein
VAIYFATKQCLGGIEAFIELNSCFMPASLQWQYRTPITTDETVTQSVCGSKIFLGNPLPSGHLDLLSLGDLREVTWTGAKASAAKWHWCRDVGRLFPLK